MADFKYTIVDDINHIIDEKGNTFIALRKMYWGEKPENAKLELRKYHNTSDGGETPSKGVTFLTEEGPHNLTHTLLGMGFGYTPRVLESIKDREDFRTELGKVLSPDDELYKHSETPQNLYVPGDDLDYEEE